MKDATGGGSVRINVSVPAQLLEEARAANPDLSPSALLREALRGVIGCDHEALVCSRCEAPVRQVDVAQRALTRFYSEVQGAIGDHARKGRTVEGLARRVKEIGEAHHIRMASEHPMPGMTRAERHAAKVKELPPAAPPVRVATKSKRRLPAIDEAG